MRTRAAGTGRRRQQQRPATRQHNALPAHGQAAFDQRLQRACAGDTGQGPAGKRQQQLARAGAENQRVKSLYPRPLRVFQQQCVRALRGHHAGATHQAHVRAGRQRCAQTLCRCGRRCARTAAPDLTAGCRVVVDHGDLPARVCRSPCRTQARRACADDEQRALVAWAGGARHGAGWAVGAAVPV